MKIYYSRSNEVADEIVQPLLLTFINNLPGCVDIELLRHKRGRTYDPEIMKSADLMIVGVRDMRTDEPEIAKGCHSEIKYAQENCIPVLTILNERDSASESISRYRFEQITISDVDIKNENCYQLGYAILDMFNNVKSAKYSGQCAGFITSRNHIEEAMRKLYSKEKYDQLFVNSPEYADCTDHDTTSELQQGDSVKVLSCSVFSDETHESRIGQEGKIQNPRDSAHDVVVIFDDNKAQAYWFKRENLALISRDETIHEGVVNTPCADLKAKPDDNYHDDWLLLG